MKKYFREENELKSIHKIENEKILQKSKKPGITEKLSVFV